MSETICFFTSGLPQRSRQGGCRHRRIATKVG
jgi:hypothetical protein